MTAGHEASDQSGFEGGEDPLGDPRRSGRAIRLFDDLAAEVLGTRTGCDCTADSRYPHCGQMALGGHGRRSKSSLITIASTRR